MEANKANRASDRANLFIGTSERLRNRVVLYRRKKHILGEVELHAMPLADRDGRRNLHEAIQNRRGRLGDRGCSSASEDLGAGAGQYSSALGDL
jgi:hypothetical protein